MITKYFKNANRVLKNNSPKTIIINSSELIRMWGLVITSLLKYGKEIIGNHRHILNSNQWEFIYVLHQNTKIKIFDFRYKNYDGPIKKKILFAGDCVSVPPGCALGLLPLIEDSILIEISNKVYHDNYEKINLFT